MIFSPIFCRRGFWQPSWFRWPSQLPQGRGIVTTSTAITPIRPRPISTSTTTGLPSRRTNPSPITTDRSACVATRAPPHTEGRMAARIPAIDCSVRGNAHRVQARRSGKTVRGVIASLRVGMGSQARGDYKASHG